MRQGQEHGSRRSRYLVADAGSRARHEGIRVGRNVQDCANSRSRQIDLQRAWSTPAHRRPSLDFREDLYRVEHAPSPSSAKGSESTCCHHIKCAWIASYRCGLRPPTRAGPVIKEACALDISQFPRPLPCNRYLSASIPPLVRIMCCVPRVTCTRRGRPIRTVASGR